MREMIIKILWGVVALAILLVVFMVFKDQIFNLFGIVEKKYISSPTEKAGGSEEEYQTRSLGISEINPPEEKIYKLFRNFDPSFLKEKNNFGDSVYNVFVLDLDGNTYNGFSNILIEKISEGIGNFSKIDKNYQIGNDAQQLPSCINPSSVTGGISYNNDCWTPAQDATLNLLSDPCKILVNNNNFDGKVKIRVGWKISGKSWNTGRDIAYVLVTVCDD